jgi:serine/threonine-protein kinase
MKTCPVCDTDYTDERATCPTDGAMLIVSHELAPGSLVRGKYRIVRKLGQGGMGVVYLAEDILLGVSVALKFLAGDLGKDPKFIKRFRVEARTAYQLRHPNIVDVTSLDQAEDGTLFIAMEFVPGPSLRAALEQARRLFEIPRALGIAREIAAGLVAAHSLGTVHRDIKPENVLLAPVTGGGERPKILDFGIVAVAESVSRTSLTRGLILTPNYAAPEQWMEMPAGEMDGRTDLYALGGLLYEMLTGATPFHAHNLSGWMKQHLQETPRPPSLFRPEVASWPELDSLVLRLLAKDREHRPRSAAELLILLDAARGAPVETAPPSYSPRGWEAAATAPLANATPNPAAEPSPRLAAPPTAISARAADAEAALPTTLKQDAAPLDPLQVPASRPKLAAFSPWAWAALALLGGFALFGAWRVFATHMRSGPEATTQLSSNPDPPTQYPAGSTQQQAPPANSKPAPNSSGAPPVAAPANTPPAAPHANPAGNRSWPAQKAQLYRPPNATYPRSSPPRGTLTQPRPR